MMAPRLNRSLTLMTPVQTPDEAGGYVTAWVSLGVLWAALSPAGNSEAAGSVGAPVGRSAYKVVLRAAATGSPRRPKPGQRFVIGSRRFDVETVVEADTDARYLVCLCKEEVAS